MGSGAKRQWPDGKNGRRRAGSTRNGHCQRARGCRRQPDAARPRRFRGRPAAPARETDAPCTDNRCRGWHFTDRQKADALVGDASRSEEPSYEELALTMHELQRRRSARAVRVAALSLSTTGRHKPQHLSSLSRRANRISSWGSCVHGFCSKRRGRGAPWGAWLRPCARWARPSSSS